MTTSSSLSVDHSKEKLPTAQTSAAVASKTWTGEWLKEFYGRFSYYLAQTILFFLCPGEFQSRLMSTDWSWSAPKDTESKEKTKAEDENKSLVAQIKVFLSEVRNGKDKHHDSYLLRPDRFISNGVFSIVLFIQYLEYKILGKPQEFFFVSVIIKLLSIHLFIFAAALFAHLAITTINRDTKFNRQAFSKTWGAIAYSYAGPALFGIALAWLPYYFLNASPEGNPFFDQYQSAEPIIPCLVRGLLGYTEYPIAVPYVHLGVLFLYSSWALQSTHGLTPTHSRIAALIATLVADVLTFIALGGGFTYYFFSNEALAKSLCNSM